MDWERATVGLKYLAYNFCSLNFHSGKCRFKVFRKFSIPILFIGIIQKSNKNVESIFFFFSIKKIKFSIIPSWICRNFYDNLKSTLKNTPKIFDSKIKGKLWRYVLIILIKLKKSLIFGEKMTRMRSPVDEKFENIMLNKTMWKWNKLYIVIRFSKKYAITTTTTLKAVTRTKKKQYKEYNNNNKHVKKNNSKTVTIKIEQDIFNNINNKKR